MAFIKTFICEKCGKSREEVDFGTNVCAECRAKESSRARRVHLASLRGLTLEERIEKLEEEMYDTKAKERLATLEAQNAKY